MPLAGSLPMYIYIYNACVCINIFIYIYIHTHLFARNLVRSASYALNPKPPEASFRRLRFKSFRPEVAKFTGAGVPLRVERMLIFLC